MGGKRPTAGLKAGGTDTVGLTCRGGGARDMARGSGSIDIGEIRDVETAEIACRAALVGRLVLSTLHARAPGLALTRLMDLGVYELQPTKC